MVSANQISSLPRCSRRARHAVSHYLVRRMCVAAFFMAAVVMPERTVHAQALEPRSYANTPVGINFVLLGYGYTEGGVTFDASIPITDASVHVHTGLVAYARSIDVW